MNDLKSLRMSVGSMCFDEDNEMEEKGNALRVRGFIAMT